MNIEKLTIELNIDQMDEVDVDSLSNNSASSSSSSSTSSLTTVEETIGIVENPSEE